MVNPKSVCACGHLGDGDDSQHLDTVQPGHGACTVSGCECAFFTWAGFIPAYQQAVTMEEPETVPLAEFEDITEREPAPRMMPGQEPYSSEELPKLYKLVSDAADDDPGEDNEPQPITYANGGGRSVDGCEVDF